MELTFQTFQQKAAYGDPRKLVIQGDEVLAKPVTRGWHKIEKQQVNQSLLQAMKAEGLDDDIIRYSIGFETREKNWDRKLEKFEKGGIRLTARAMKIISDRTEICILRNREANKQFISKTIAESFLKENIPNWDDLEEERKQGIIQMIPKRLERMGLDGKHKLTYEDVEKAAHEEIVQYRLTREYRKSVDENYLKEAYRLLPSESRLLPEEKLHLDKLAQTIRDDIKKRYHSGLEVTCKFVNEITESHLKHYVKTKAEKPLLPWKNDVTKYNLVTFSRETMGLGNLLQDRNLTSLIQAIKNKIDEKWASAGYLNQDVINTIFQEQITVFQKDQEQQVPKAQADFMAKWRSTLLKNFSEHFLNIRNNLRFVFWILDLDIQLLDRYRNTIQKYVESSSPPIHIPYQLEAVVELATEWLLFTNPDTLKDVKKKIEKEILPDRVKEIRSAFSEYDSNNYRPYDAPELDLGVVIRQAQELAEKMAGKELPDLMQTLQEK